MQWVYVHSEQRAFNCKFTEQMRWTWIHESRIFCFKLSVNGHLWVVLLKLEVSAMEFLVVLWKVWILSVYLHDNDCTKNVKNFPLHSWKVSHTDYNIVKMTPVHTHTQKWLQTGQLLAMSLCLNLFHTFHGSKSVSMLEFMIFDCGACSQRSIF